ncbi:MAG: hypothetical protein OXL97_00710 [Chloroflexota bacterium]|nr:hypothetical protein [Chloroflexota bacterium]MDE2883664.1 hypothetical protein [Chloroflexota bacterium]
MFYWIIRLLRSMGLIKGYGIEEGLIHAWERLIEENHELFSQMYQAKEVESFRNTRIRIVEILLNPDRTQGFALVRPSDNGQELSKLVLATLLRTSVDEAPGVDGYRRMVMTASLGRPVPTDQVVVVVRLEGSTWEIVAATREPEDPVDEEESDVPVAVGEPIQLQDSWKEAPYAITVLGVAEAVDRSTARVPVRVTSITPIWSYDNTEISLTILSDKSQSHRWSNLGCRDGTFDGVVLVKGGSHEGFICFKADEDKDNVTFPENGFAFLQYLDGSEEFIQVDLTRSMPVPERLRFEEGKIGTLWDDPAVDGVQIPGSRWKDFGQIPVAGIGDTVTVQSPSLYPAPDFWQPWFDLTVVEPVEFFDNQTLRVLLRITSRQNEELRCAGLDYLLSSAPDTYGRLHSLWKSEYLDGANAAFPDSFAGISLAQGESHEGYAYFRTPDGQESLSPPSFSFLWYGAYLMELPIFLATQGNVSA